MLWGSLLRLWNRIAFGSNTFEGSLSTSYFQGPKIFTFSGILRYIILSHLIPLSRSFVAMTLSRTMLSQHFFYILLLYWMCVNDLQLCMTNVLPM